MAQAACVEKKNMTGIYKISSICKPHRIYVGSAINVSKRKMEHLYSLRSGKHFSKKLQRHYNKYGECDLLFSIIEEVGNKEMIIEREQFYIDNFLPYFNSRPTAHNNLGMKFGQQTEGHRKKISIGNKGVKKPGTSDRLSIPVHKYDLSGNLIMTYKGLAEAIRKEGIRIKISNNVNKTIGGFVWVSSKGKAPDFKKISESLLNCKKAKCLRVAQIDKSGNVINEFDGVRIASRETGIDHRSIQSVASGSNPKRHTAGGFKWIYK